MSLQVLYGLNVQNNTDTSIILIEYLKTLMILIHYSLSPLKYHGKGLLVVVIGLGVNGKIGVSMYF